MRVEVTGISWHRFYLRFQVEVSQAAGEVAFYLSTDDACGRVGYVLDVIGRERDAYLLEANITNNGMCACLAYGSYHLVAADGEGTWRAATLGPQAARDALECFKAFPFGILGLSYVVYFDVHPEGGKRLLVVSAARSSLDIEAHAELGVSQQAAPSVPPRSAWANRIVDCGKRAFTMEYRVLHSVFRALGARPCIVFASQVSDVMQPNMRAVVERMGARGLTGPAGSLDVRVACAKAHGGARGLVDDALTVFALSRADTIVIDDYAPVFNWLAPAPDVDVIQLWHSGAGFKSVGYARWGLADAPAPDSAYRRATYAVSSSRKVSEYLSEAFGVNVEQVLPLGMPRMDGLLDEGRLADARARLYAKLPQCQDAEVVLFAPTYRGRSRAEAHYPFDVIDFDALYEACGDKRVVLFKMHPWVERAVPVPERYADKLIDVGSSEDINDLFAIADVLVTDYSSNVFEFSLFGKPMLFFAFDEEDYARSRGFHRDYRAGIPGKLCTSASELAQALERRDYEFEKVAPFVAEHFDALDDGATDRVIDYLLLKEMPAERERALEKRRRQLDEAFSLAFPSGSSGMLQGAGRP